MKKFIKISVTPLVVGVIAAILVFVDSIVAPIFAAGISFTWMAFVNWTVFFNASLNERLRAIIGYVIGYLAANAIIFIQNNLGVLTSTKLINITIASILAVFIINMLVMYFDRAKKLYLDSISGIFVGIALTFSGAGISMQANNPKLLLIIIVYGMLGLLCGLATNFFSSKISKKLDEK